MKKINYENLKKYTDYLDSVSQKIKIFEEELRDCNLPISVFINFPTNDENTILLWNHNLKRLVVSLDGFFSRPLIEYKIEIRIQSLPFLEILKDKINQEIENLINQIKGQNHV